MRWFSIELDDASDACGDDWQPRRHRLQHAVGERFRARGQHEQVARGEQGRHVIGVPDELHARRDALRLRKRFKFLPPWAVARNDELGVGTPAQDERRGLEQHFVRLLRPQVRDGDDAANGTIVVGRRIGASHLSRSARRECASVARVP